MDKAAVAKKSVLESVLEWSLDRPVWQRDALRRIVNNGGLTEDDFRELTELCKTARGAEPGQIEPIPLAQAHIPANPDHGAAVTLLSIGNVQGANNLAPAQTLIFEQQGLTVVYGDNGAGKSGYARILKRACRARHAVKIEPNVYDDQAPKIASADLTFSIAGTPQASMRWQDNPHPHAELSAISVFDSDCASVHVKDKNEVAFRPFGLDVPDELAHACQEVKNRITAEQRQLEKGRNPIFATPSWKATTAVGKALAALSVRTDIKVIEKLATLSNVEIARLERLRDDLAKNPVKASAEQALKADNIKRVIEAVMAAEAASADEALTAVAKATREARVKRDAARSAAEKAFGGEDAAGVGGEVWRELWESAKRYSMTTAFPEQPFPPSAVDARCVLCLQPLSQDALGRMARFDEFIQRDTELHAQTAERTAKDARSAISRARLRTLDYKTALDEIGLQDTALQKATRKFVASARLRRNVLLRSLDTGSDDGLPPFAPSPMAALAELEAKLRKYADELRRAAGTEEREKLEGELVELNDRSLLNSMLPTVAEEVERLKAIQFLASCLTDTTTTAITKFGNEIADTVITPKMRDRFQNEITRLAAEKVRVEVVRSGGRYGSPQYQVRLFANPDAKVHDVLSEGERTCVALAAFLAELATAAHQSALVFDDPVSSLDHRWRGKVAERIADEATQRQVIVFTHDLVFVNDLVDRAQAHGIAPRLVTLSRGPAGAGQVADGLPWKAQSVEDRLDRLEKAARAAKVRYEDDDDEAYETAVVKIYDQLRATWERGLEDIAFSRVVQRHRDYINAKDLKKVSVLTDVDCDAFAVGFKKCCDIVDAHDPSRGRNASVPPPGDLLTDIQALKDWTTSLRNRQKQVA